MNVYQKLNAARTKFHSLELKKTGHNKFAGYNYFELGDFLIPALKVFEEVGLCATVSFEASQAALTIRDVEKPMDAITITSPMGSAQLKGCHEVQNIGAVETYQRRYLWVAALEIVEHDAVDAGEPVKAAPKDAGGVIKGTDGAMEALDEEAQGYIRRLAASIPLVMVQNGIKEVCDRLEREELDNDHKVALWSLLDSKTRSAIKKEQQARWDLKEAATRIIQQQQGAPA